MRKLNWRESGVQRVSHFRSPPMLCTRTSNDPRAVSERTRGTLGDDATDDAADVVADVAIDDVADAVCGRADEYAAVAAMVC